MNHNNRINPNNVFNLVESINKVNRLIEELLFHHYDTGYVLELT